MRLLGRLVLGGLAGLATALGDAQTAAGEVCILSSKTATSTSSTPQIPRQVARHILFQRLGAQSQLNDLPESTATDEALGLIEQYGIAPKPLFGDDAAQDIAPSQLVVILEGVTESNSGGLRKRLSGDGASIRFDISDVPSAAATKHLVDVELSGLSRSCDIAAAVNPYDKCWNGKMSLVVLYDVVENPDIIEDLTKHLPSLQQAVASHTLETTIVLLAEKTRHSTHRHWSDVAASELRRRAEAPLAEAKVVVAPGSGGESLSSVPATSPLADDPTTPAAKMNYGCFATHNSCVTATGNCTGHGTCIDKYAASRNDGQEDESKCFVCACGRTRLPVKEDGLVQHTYWGGAYCQKVDVSSPFWLLAGTTILLLGIVTGCISLLFNVGSEKLPGVIGAGVSRSK